MVTARLGALSETERHALELTALGEPLAQPALDQLADADAIEVLEDRGLITSRMDGRRLQVCLAHPVYGDVLRAGINPRHQRLLARELTEAAGGRRQDDTLLMASLGLVSGEGSAELLLAGAKAACERRDYELTEQLARAAMENGEGFEARLLAAEAAHRSGRHEQAARELASLGGAATGVGERVQVALLAFDHQYTLRGTADMGAIDGLLELELAPVWRDELLARRLRIDGMTKGPRDVVDAMEPLPEATTAPRTSIHTLVGECLTRTGRLHQALAFLVPPSGATVRQGSTVLSEAWSPFGHHAAALIGLGRLGEAEELLAAAQRDHAAHPGSPESAVIAASLGALRMEQGRVQTAFLQATSAAAVFLDLGLPVAARWCEVLSSHALALAGVSPKATQTLDALDALGLPTDMVFEVDVRQARAWASAAGGDMGAARKQLEGAAELGKEMDDLLGATRALHGLARMGRARQVVDDMATLASKVDGDLTAARLSYTQAAAEKDSSALAESARRFEDLGALLYAAEALGEAAVHLRRDGASREAAATQQTAARLLARCEGAVTPFVPRHRGARTVDSGRARYRAAGRHRQLRQADRRNDEPLGAHRRESPASGLPETRHLSSTRAGRGAARPARDLITPRSSVRRAPGGPPGEGNQDDGGDDPDGRDVDQPEEALAAYDGQARHGPERQHRTNGDGERIVVVGGQVGGEDLCQVAPFGEKDHQKRSDSDPAVRRHLPLHDLFVLLLLALLDRLADGERSTHEEHPSDDGIEHLVGQEVEQRHPDRDRDDDVHQEACGRTEPHDGRATPRRQDERSKHGLVRQLADKDDREDGEDDGKLHGGLSLGPERSGSLSAGRIGAARRRRKSNRAQRPRCCRTSAPGPGVTAPSW